MTLKNTIPPDLNFELQSLAAAINYQRWIFRSISLSIGSRVMEIGAGIGNMSRWFPACEKLILTETDPSLLAILRQSAAAANPKVSIRKFNVLDDDLVPFCNENLDTIVSFNVFEHLPNDRLAMERLCSILRHSRVIGPKRLITFVPAHAWAFGATDKAFGHYRRYSKATLKTLCTTIAPEATFSARYFNAFGLLGWAWNSRIANNTRISLRSIRIFEKLCPFLGPIDDIAHNVFHLPFGQSLLGILTWNQPKDTR